MNYRISAAPRILAPGNQAPKRESDCHQKVNSVATISSVHAHLDFDPTQRVGRTEGCYVWQRSSSSASLPPNVCLRSRAAMMKLNYFKSRSPLIGLATFGLHRVMSGLLSCSPNNAIICKRIISLCQRLPPQQPQQQGGENVTEIKYLTEIISQIEEIYIQEEEGMSAAMLIARVRGPRSSTVGGCARREIAKLGLEIDRMMEIFRSMI